MDEYRKVPGFDQYEVNRQGVLRSTLKSKRGLLKPAKRYTLYAQPLFGVSFSASKLVAIAFPDEDIKLPRKERKAGKRKHAGSDNPNFKRWYVVNGKKFDLIALATKYYNKIMKANASERTVQRKCINRVEICYCLEKNRLTKK